MAHQITIIDYNPQWPILFQEELFLLNKAIGDYVADIQHIGSTSVPELAAKPVIDIMVGVPTLAIADQFCIQPLLDLGYEYVKKYEATIPHRRYFRKSNPQGIRSHHLHMVAIDSEWWRKHIAFRDYLRTHPQTRDEYAMLKKRLAKQTYENKHDYADLKSDFINGVLEIALKGN